MARNSAAPSRMEILLLTSLCRAPMHGYELKLEMQYKHVQWWAKCEHGHIYAALARLEKGKYIRQVRRAGGRSTQKVYTCTPAGRKRLENALQTLGMQDDETYFDVDMFIHSCHVLERSRVLEILEGRKSAIEKRAVDATRLAENMRPHVPTVAVLIMEHRVEYLTREVAFLGRAIEALRAERQWGSFLGETRIEDFVKRTRVPLESH
jgi:DNA-binding PadR family transcriptional regulator